MIDHPEAALQELDTITTRAEDIDVVGIDVTTLILFTLSDGVKQNETVRITCCMASVSLAFLLLHDYSSPRVCWRWWTIFLK